MSAQRQDDVAELRNGLRWSGGHGCGRLLVRGSDRGYELVLASEDHFLLVTEVTEERRAPDLRPVGDVRDGHGVEAALGEQLLGCAHDALPGLQAFALDQRRSYGGVEIFSFNPGLVPGTGLQRDAGAITRFAFNRIMPIMTLTPYARSMKVSGADLAAAAIGPAPGPSGSYINGKTVEPSSPASYDPEREDALWDELERIAGHPSVALAS